MSGDLITQAEAAQLTGRSVPAVNELVRRGRLRSFEMYGKRLVSRTEVLAFEPNKGGRPPKQAAVARKRTGDIRCSDKTPLKPDEALRKIAEEKQQMCKKRGGTK